MQKLVFFVLLFVNINADEQCFVDTTSPYKYFSDRTSYYASRESQFDTPESCTPTYLWALIRHGTRYPGIAFITSMKNLTSLRDEIMENHQNGRGHLCAKDLENFKNWKTNLTEHQRMMLTPQGRKDQIILAQKLKEKFPDLFNASSKNSFLFQSSPTKRTKQSALAFSNELLNTKHLDFGGNNITENEKLLYFYGNKCPRYSLQVRNISLTPEEVNLFEKTEVMQKVISEISNRLGFEQPLPYTTIDLMYGTCAYESAWYIDSRPAFCAAFTPNQLKVFEYKDDLKGYYQYGYNNSFSEDMGCILVKDMMFSLLKAAKNTEKNRKATFYFSHFEMVTVTNVKLGLNRDDEPLKYVNYERMKNDRKWKLSSFGSFAANIIAVLYKCSGPQGQQNKVIFYQNERQVEIPKCTQNPCILEDLLQNFQEVFNETLCSSRVCEITQSNLETSSKANVIVLNFSITLIILLMSRCILL